MNVISRRSTMSSYEEEQFATPAYITALTTPQRDTLTALKQLCAKNNIYWHVDRKRAIKYNEDVTLIRYLKARSFQVQAAYKQYAATIAWRRKIGLDDLYRHADLSQFSAISRLMPQWTGRRSRQGVPVFVYSVAKIQPTDLLSTSSVDPSLSSVFLPAEYSTQFIQPVCGKLHANGAMPVLMHIIDLTGVGLKHFWNLRAHLQKAAGMATSHYPESVDKIFIVGAPSFFPTIWGYITKWFDPAITSKISVLPASKTKDVLMSHIHPRDLPKSFGGQLDWEYGMDPIVDSEIRALLGSMADDWIEGPLVWESEGDPTMEDCSEKIIAVGTERGKKARAQVVAKFPGGRLSSDTE